VASRSVWSPLGNDDASCGGVACCNPQARERYGTRSGRAGSAALTLSGVEILEPQDDDMSRTGPAHELLRIAELSACAAGRVLTKRSASVREVRRKSSAADLVTDADLAAESVIRKTILQHRPDDAILGEERGEKPGSTSIRWVVDPLDGTVNYVARIAEWAVSIAVEHVTAGFVAGVVHAPRLGRTYSAVRGGGAWCNGASLPVRGPVCAPLGECVVATGFAADPSRRLVQAAQLAHVLPQVRDIRCRGAASLELCAVAANEIDGYFESDLSLWDIAAGRLIATESGVEVSPHAPPGGPPLIAAPPATAKALAILLAGATDPFA
jgi:myo-inositol-1(or 4)-monophosphatase